ncbi:MAG: protein kinase [Myxococcota bacterium]
MSGRTSFGRYQLSTMVGSGGMAQVHLAIQLGPQGYKKPCVLKRIAPEHAKSAVFRTMFLEEARISALLTHPAIVSTFDFGEVEGVPFMAMELVDGPNLARLCSTLAKNLTWIPIRAAVELGARVAEGLAYAHQLTSLEGVPLNLVHRDVSPQNILVSRNGDVKLSDFGIARHDQRENVTTIVQPKGKPGYMALEQALGRPVDGRADLFALGVVLVELVGARRLLAGGLPSNLDILPARVEQHLRAHPQCPDRLRTLLLEMTAVDPNKRLADAQRVARELREIAEALPGRGLGAFLSEAIGQYFPRSNYGIGTANTPAPASWNNPPPVEEEPPTTLGKEAETEWQQATELDATVASAISTAYDAMLSDRSFRLELESIPVDPPGSAPVKLGWGAIAPSPPAPPAPAPTLPASFAGSQVLELDRSGHTTTTVDRPPRAKPAPETMLPFPAQETQGTRIRPLWLVIAGVALLAVAGVVRVLTRTPPPPPQMSIEVSSSPSGARIIVDGQDSGKQTPALLELAPTGAYRVNVSKPGFVSAIREGVTVVAEAGRRIPIDISLLRARVFRLESTPPGAQVTVNDVLLPMRTPVSLPPMVLGASATVSLSLTGYVEGHLVLLAQTETSTEVNIDLVEGEEISVNTEPSGAELYIDDRRVGISPLESVVVPKAKPFVLKAVRPAYKTETRRLNRRSIVDGKVELTLNEQPLTRLPLSKEDRRDAARIQENLARLRAQRDQARRTVAQLEAKMREIEASHPSSIKPATTTQAALLTANSRLDDLEQRVEEAENALEEIRARGLARAAGEGGR